MGSISPVLSRFQVNNTDVSYLSSAIGAGMGEIQHFVGSFKAALKSVEGDKVSLLSENKFSLLSAGTTTAPQRMLLPSASSGREQWEKRGGFGDPLHSKVRFQGMKRLVEKGSTGS